jgi:hypothetical protein
MTAYTFSTSSAGGRNAVRDLGDNIARVRKMRSNPNLVPLVELSAEVMPTKFGKKSKPLFKIIKWGGGSAAPDESKQLGEHDPSGDADAADHAMNDSIPF